MSTVRGGTSDCRTLGCFEQRPVSQVTLASSPDFGRDDANHRECARRQPNGSSLRGWVRRRHRNHRNEPADKATIRLSGPTGSSDSSGLIRVRVRSARRVENHLSSLVRRVHWDEPLQTQVTYGYIYPVSRDPSGYGGWSASRPPNATLPTPRGLRAATARQQRAHRPHRQQSVVSHGSHRSRRSRVHRAQRHQPRAVFGLQRHGGTVSSGHDTNSPPRAFGSQQTEHGVPSDPRMLSQRTFAGVADRLGGSGWSLPGMETGRLAEHDGPGSTCPLGHPRPGKACPSGRNGSRPPHLCGCNGQGLARPSGATGFNLRILAGATVGAPCTHRAHGTQHRAVHSDTTAITDRNARSGKANRGFGQPSGCPWSLMTGGFPKGLSPCGIRVVRIRLGQAVRDSRPTVGEPTSDTVPGEKQSAFGEATTGGHLAPRGVRLLERETL
jgi:hypothetical protein